MMGCLENNMLASFSQRSLGTPAAAHVPAALALWLMERTQSSEEVVESALQSVRAAGGRATSAKRSLLEILAANPGHLSAEQLTELVQRSNPDLASSTVYRILEELERIGVVEHSHAGKGPATYHLASEAHGHLVCQRCGEMLEAPPELFDELVREAARRFDFQVDPHHFAVLGSCSRCRAAD
jgi:Fe2+ or Zn2+ uptake regulation protein